MELEIAISLAFEGILALPSCLTLVVRIEILGC